MMDIKLKVGLRIREIRVSKNLTQEKLAFFSGVDKTYISEVENGKRNISIVNLEKLLLSLDVSFQEFFDNPDFIIKS